MCRYARGRLSYDETIKKPLAKGRLTRGYVERTFTSLKDCAAKEKDESTFLNDKYRDFFLGVYIFDIN